MARKKNRPTTSSTTNLPTLHIGTRVRSRDDAVLGRIVWANAVSVKIKWDDNEQLTCRRDALASKAIEIIDDETAPAAEPNTEPPTTEPEAEQPAVPTTAEETTSREEAPETAPTEAPIPGTVPTVPQPTTTAASELPEEEQPDILGFDQHGAPYKATAETTPPQPEADVTPAAEETTPPAQSVATTEAETPAGVTSKDGGKKMSAIDAAYRVLAEEQKSMSTKEMIEKMAQKGYWTSRAGKTPSATLYSALLREITEKGGKSRFTKVGRGQFAART
jgi:HB1, ASXL, restriction endonuclease HTH domain